MSVLHRRAFLRGSLGGLGALSLTGCVQGFDGVSALAPDNATEFPGADTLFLTWQRDPTTTMTIQWIGPEPTGDVAVLSAKAAAPVWRRQVVTTKPYPGTSSRVYRCELTGLDPGEEYGFQIGAATRMYRFRTMPAKATDTIQFVSGGDAGVNEHAVATNLLAARQDPWFALIGGDLAYDNGRSPDTFTGFLKNYHAQMRDSTGRLIPMISCIGNHEVQGGYNATREKSPQYLSVFDGFFAETTYGVLDIGDYLSIVLLDTGHIAPISGAQTDWLGGVLKERQERPHLIVANHVPAYPSVRSPQGGGGKFGTGEEQRQHWCPLFEQYKVDVVLEHHDHAFKRTHPLTDGRYDKHGVVYLGDGSWGKLRGPHPPEERPYLARTAGSYHVTVHRLEGEERFHVAIEDSGKVADVCATRNKRPSRRG